MSSALLKFTPYQWFVIAILAFLQFSIILDFMVLSPLGAQLLEELDITTTQFGLVVSAYAFSAGASGILAAGFAIVLTAKNCYCSFMPVLLWAPCFVGSPQPIFFCCWPALLPAFLAE